MLLPLFLAGIKILILFSNKGFIIRPLLLNLIVKNYIILFLIGLFFKNRISFIAYKNYHFTLYDNLLANNLAFF